MTLFSGQVSFEMSDITKHDFPPNSFDVIYSRDTILHIGDKNALFKKFFVRLYNSYTP